MKQSYTLIKTELLEHKIIVRLPVFLALFSMLVVVMILTNINNFSFNIQTNGFDGWQPPITTSSFAGIVGSASFFCCRYCVVTEFFYLLCKSTCQRA